MRFHISNSLDFIVLLARMMISIIQNHELINKISFIWFFLFTFYRNGKFNGNGFENNNAYTSSQYDFDGNNLYYYGRRKRSDNSSIDQDSSLSETNEQRIQSPVESMSQSLIQCMLLL